MSAGRSVVIDCFPDSVRRYREGYAIVAIDVIRATTTAVTAVAMGRRCFPVPSIEHALPIAARLDQPLLVGELGGNMPYGFDLTNSPAELAQRRVQEGRHLVAGALERLGRLRAELVHRPGDVRVVPLEMIDHRVDHHLRLLRGVRAVEVDQPVSAGELPTQDREVRPDQVQPVEQAGELTSRRHDQRAAAPTYLS